MQKFHKDQVTDRFQAARAAYDSFADRYDNWGWQEFWRRNEFPQIQRLLDSEEKVTRMLDVGAGTGFYLEKLLNYSEASVGMDVSQKMLSVAKKRLKGQAHLVCADATEIPFSAGSFDIILMLRVASHIQNLEKLLAELSRVLTKRGRLIVSDIAPEHAYSCTEFDVPFRRVMVETYKHSVEDWRDVAKRNSLNFICSASITAANADWLPASGFSSIDRVGDRPIGFVVAFDRV